MKFGIDLEIRIEIWFYHSGPNDFFRAGKILGSLPPTEHLGRQLTLTGRCVYVYEEEEGRKKNLQCQYATWLNST